MGNGISIIENTEQAQREYGRLYGGSCYTLTQEQITALMAGKQLAFTDGEYATFISIKQPEKEWEEVVEIKNGVMTKRQR